MSWRSLRGLWQRLSIGQPALITPLQLLPLAMLDIKTIEVEWHAAQAPEWDENRGAIKTLLYPLS